MKRIAFPVIVALALMTTLFFLSVSDETAESTYVLNAGSWPGGTTAWRANLASFPTSLGNTTAIQNALESAADAWELQSCANWSFSYLGTTTQATVSNNNTHAVYWDSGSSGNALATTYTWTAGGSLTEFDMVFWGGVNWSLNGGGYDVQGIGTHEFGHALGLGHETCDSSATMWPSTSAGSSISRRSLESDDIAGVEAKYGGNCGIPSPNPMTFALDPYEFQAGLVVMTATTASPAPVEYLFTLVSQSGTGGNSTGWQSGAGYVDSGVSPNGGFTYNVKARNANTLQETSPSANKTAWTLPGTPGTVTTGNVTTSSFDILSLDTGPNPANSLMAVEVSGQYVSASGALQANEQWILAPLWSGITVTGLAQSTNHAVRCKVLGFSTGVHSSFGPSTNVTTGSAGPLDESCAAGTISDGAGGTANILQVSGSDGGTTREVTVSIGQPFSIDVQQPPLNAFPSNFIIWGWVGIPGNSWQYNISPSIGTLCLTPCEVNPGLPVLTVMSSYGGALGGCPVFVQANPAPYSFSHPGFPFGLAPITFQGVAEIFPGFLRTTNAVVFYYQ